MQRKRERKRNRESDQALAILNALWLSRERSRDYPNSSHYQCALLFFNGLGAIYAVSNNPTNVSINAVVDLFGIFTRNELQRLTTIITREFQLHGEKRTVTSFMHTVERMTKYSKSNIKIYFYHFYLFFIFIIFLTMESLINLESIFP